MTKKIILHIVFLLGLVSNAVSQDAKFTASVNKANVALNEQFQLTFTINTNASQFSAPPLNSFHVLSGPNQSTSMQFVNGQMSQSVSLSYILQPKQEGKFEIAPAQITVGNNRLSSNPVSINVTKAKASGKQNSGSQDNQSVQGGASVFIKAIVNKSSVYQGEGITLTYKLYTNVDILNYAINNMPSMNGFYSQDVKLPDQLQLSNEVIDGVNYKVGEIKKMVLFPQQSGSLNIEKMTGECIARVKTRSNRNPNDPFSVFNDPFFNDPFFGFGNARDIKVAIESNTLKINVKTLPEPKPDNFSGTVGTITFDATVDKDRLKANDALTLKLKFSGKGNLKLIDPPKPELSSDFEVYDPKVSDRLSSTASGVSGSIEYEYLIIPRIEGEYKIPELSFSYFDPSQQKYFSSTKGPFILHVEKGDGSVSAVTQTTKSDFKELGKDIQYLKTNYTPGQQSKIGGFSYFMYALPYFLLASLILLRRKHLKDRANMTHFKSRQAVKIAKQNLRHVAAVVDDKNTKRFYEETLKAMYGFIANRFKLNQADLSRDTAENMLQSSGASEALIANYMNVIKQCEMVQYGMFSDTDEKRKEIYSLASEAIIQTEQELRTQ
ncbi:MAG TPA: BatD family protein [Bacteroidia bacterium]|nr:BatD family protein [Bacteroidia bacterium]HNT80918.1 BatD family protein [Bacteroidia bacterium]